MQSIIFFQLEVFSTLFFNPWMYHHGFQIKRHVKLFIYIRSLNLFLCPLERAENKRWGRWKIKRLSFIAHVNQLTAFHYLWSIRTLWNFAGLSLCQSVFLSVHNFLSDLPCFFILDKHWWNPFWGKFSCLVDDGWKDAWSYYLNNVAC